MEAVLDTGFSLLYRDQVLNFLLPLFPAPSSRTKSSHIHSLARLLVTLNNPSLTVPLLTSLVPKERLLAYQFAFDLAEGGTRDFLEGVRKHLPEGTEVGFPCPHDSDSFVTDRGKQETENIFNKLRNILGGQESVKLYLEFLKRTNKVDMLILKNSKVTIHTTGPIMQLIFIQESLEPRSSIYHTALTLQNAFMHAGTTSDVFLRENLEWLGMATNWAKFSATAALGVIHKGYFQEGMNILGPYLPQNGAESQIQGAAYSEGGALYALGLINAGCGNGQTVENYLRDTLKNAQGEIVQHGAALGLGIAGMGGRSSDAYDDLKETLFSDSAVAGEAAGYAMGLVMLGSASQTCADEMITYARETQHEKIIRGLAIALAFVFYGRQEEADETIRSLLTEKVDNSLFQSHLSNAACTGPHPALRRCLHPRSRVCRNVKQRCRSPIATHCSFGHVRRRAESSCHVTCVPSFQESRSSPPDSSAPQREL